ncbi:pilin [Tahibacter harae]|uniref:Pilin n=1 Tax=Tahibacter harae TaxID=2963937 RepID=A0ABT1QNY5_9GAMM|nr:pilin [Tahibacter harae]MCQ4163442.1 pilin [Tahibacter harae]
MSLIRHTALAAALALGLGLAGCNKEQAGPAAVKLDSAAAQRAAAAIAGPAWLRERLPEHTVAYVRIPTLWGMTAAPNGRALDPALASEAHTRLIADLRANIGKDPLLQQAGIAPAVALLLDDVTAPVEIAVIDGSDIANPASNILVSAPLKFADVAALNARLAELKSPLAALDAQGKAKLPSNGFIYFDAKSQRLYALFGMAASALALDGLVQQTAQTRPHAMLETEKTIDASGQGLFYWMSLKGVTGMASAQMPAARPGTALRDFLDKGQSIAGGWGTADGRGKLQIHMAAPGARLLSYFAPTDFKAGVKTAGRPEWAVTMAMPTTAQIAQIEANIETDFGPEARQRYAEFKEKLKTDIGVDLTGLIGLLGGSLVAFEDQAGAYSALHVPDKKALYAKLDELVAKFKWTYETVKAGKATVHHLHISGFPPRTEPGTAEEKTALDAWVQLYSRMGNHVWWTEEGDYLVFAQVPQALADRADATLDGTLDTWLRSQSYDPNATVLGITGTTRNAQRQVYYAYLGSLQALADGLGQKVDLASLPHAAELQLPVQGATGLSLDATRDRIGLSLTYEQNPAEVLFSNGGLAAVATAGILAAVAVPAYQDYAVRTQVAAVVADSGPLKQAVAEYYAAHGEMPGVDEDMELDYEGESLKYLAGYHVDQGTIVLEFGDEADSKLHGSTLLISPYLLDGELVWRCGNAAIDDTAAALGSETDATSVGDKYLPASCK